MSIASLLKCVINGHDILPEMRAKAQEIVDSFGDDQDVFIECRRCGQRVRYNNKETMI